MNAMLSISSVKQQFTVLVFMNHISVINSCTLSAIDASLCLLLLSSSMFGPNCGTAINGSRPCGATVRSENCRFTDS
jgi:hypothetical protein